MPNWLKVFNFVWFDSSQYNKYNISKYITSNNYIYINTLIRWLSCTRGMYKIRSLEMSIENRMTFYTRLGDLMELIRFGWRQTYYWRVSVALVCVQALQYNNTNLTLIELYSSCIQHLDRLFIGKSENNEIVRTTFFCFSNHVYVIAT
jgi:hypothetical protein